MVEELLAQVPGAQGVLVVTASVADRVTGALPYRPLRLDEVPVGVPWLVVAGGGRLIDEVKRWRVERSPVTQIAAIATIWGVARRHRRSRSLMARRSTSPSIPLLGLMYVCVGPNSPITSHRTSHDGPVVTPSHMRRRGYSPPWGTMRSGWSLRPWCSGWSGGCLIRPTGLT